MLLPRVVPRIHSSVTLCPDLLHLFLPLRCYVVMQSWSPCERKPTVFPAPSLLEKLSVL